MKSEFTVSNPQFPISKIVAMLLLLLLSRNASLADQPRPSRSHSRRAGADPSITGDAGAVLDRLGEMLADEGFQVSNGRLADHPSAPAVAVRLDSGKPGRTLQFNGHLDTVHLPFVAPEVAQRSHHRQRLVRHERGNGGGGRGAPRVCVRAAH